jgi:ferric-dicitrate binding protein FerR (iron transport regulator)
MDDLETLLRATGRRPSASPDRTERVEAAVRAHWRDDRRRELRRRRARTAGLLAVITLAGTAWAAQSWLRRTTVSPPRTVARVDMIADAAWSYGAPAERSTPLHSGDAVVAGTDVATGSRGRIALALSSGHSVRLDTETRVTLLSESEITLDRGAVYVDSRGDGPSTGSLRVHTPLAIVRDEGTQFEVRWLSGIVRIRVREGKVVAAVSGSSFHVDAGHQLQLRQNGIVTREAIGSDQDVDWIEGITPMLDINGRSLSAFLEWMARERGLQLRFATPEIAASAPGITLNGSIAGMTLDQALESVLSTCRMVHRINGRILLVSSSRDPGSGK